MPLPASVPTGWRRKNDAGMFSIMLSFGSALRGMPKRCNCT
jgi:hypothetical protein